MSFTHIQTAPTYCTPTTAFQPFTKESILKPFQKMRYRIIIFLKHHSKSPHIRRIHIKRHLYVSMFPSHPHSSISTSNLFHVYVCVSESPSTNYIVIDHFRDYVNSVQRTKKMDALFIDVVLLSSYLVLMTVDECIRYPQTCSSKKVQFFKFLESIGFWIAVHCTFLRVIYKST
jgi:hypothetical protein